MSRLRVVAEGDGEGPIAFDVACRNALDAALASGAIAVVILYETQRTIGWASVPPSDALCRGMVATVTDMIDPGRDE